MDLRNAFSYAAPESYVLICQGGWAVLHSKAFLVCGSLDFEEPCVAFYNQAQTVCETFQGSRSIQIDGTRLFSSTKELTLSNDIDRIGKHVLLFAANMPPESSWTKDILREDFLQRTTHIKIGMDGFCRGKIDDSGAWKPAKPGADEFQANVYDVRLVNNVWRDNPEFDKITLSDLADDSDTPLYFKLGVFYGSVVRHVSSSNQ